MKIKWKKPSQKAMMIWSLFFLFCYVCAFRDVGIAGVVAGVFTITVNWLFNLRTQERVKGFMPEPGENSGDPQAKE